MDIILAAFPGSEVISPDRDKPIPKPDPDIQAIHDGWEPIPRTPKPPPKKRGHRKVKNMDGMFGDYDG